MADFFADFTEDILKAEVTTRGNHLKDCSGVAIVTGIREDKDRSGKKAILEVTVLKVDPTTKTDINYVGQACGRQYRFQDGDADKRAAILANFKRDMCALAGIDPKKVTGDQWSKVMKAAAAGDFKGLLLRFEPYDSVTKKGEKRVFHNISALRTNNTPAEVKARAEKLAKGASPESLL